MDELFAIFVDQPALVLVPVALFAALAWWSRSRAAMAAAAAWAVYFLLESGNKARITCSGECDIRVDLLVIPPALLALSLLALVLAARRLMRRGKT
jgi:hypothetical protein